MEIAKLWAIEQVYVEMLESINEAKMKRLWLKLHLESYWDKH